jgi:hypothetical protein
MSGKVRPSGFFWAEKGQKTLITADRPDRPDQPDEG